MREVEGATNNAVIRVMEMSILIGFEKKMEREDVEEICLKEIGYLPKVVEMGMNFFIIACLNEKMYRKNQVDDWKGLREVFTYVVELNQRPVNYIRATWLIVRGIPVKLWSKVTLQNIVDLWG